ncbi:hypothetical protein CBM2637_B110425 [Cupriavidus taiwanensis]|nr:hypothetical protein CBM2637_B110425 [Cupriavidus taiwanensis]
MQCRQVVPSFLSCSAHYGSNGLILVWAFSYPFGNIIVCYQSLAFFCIVHQIDVGIDVKHQVAAIFEGRLGDDIKGCHLLFLKDAVGNANNGLLNFVL